MIVRTVTALRALVLGALMLACDGRSRGGEETGSPHPVQSGEATLAEFVVDTATVDVPLDLPAQLYVEHDAVVVARSPGTVDSLLVDVGDRVRGGQLLAKLESADQEIALATAESQLENLGRVATRTRSLTTISGATAADSEQAEFQLRQADIARRKARRDLDLTRVVAPFDGIVSARYIRPRRYVAVGDTLFRVSEAEPLYASVHVPETSQHAGEGPQIALEHRVTMVGIDGARAVAQIVRVAPIIDPASATREFIVRLVGSSRRFVPGEAVRVQLGSERRRVTRVPRAAIARDGFALVVENGRNVVRPVIVGADLGGGYVEIVSGVAPGESLAAQSPQSPNRPFAHSPASARPER